MTSQQHPEGWAADPQGLAHWTVRSMCERYEAARAGVTTSHGSEISCRPSRMLIAFAGWHNGAAEVPAARP